MNVLEYTPGLPWYCAFTKSRQEDFAALHLQRQAITVFLPKYKSRRIVRGEVVSRIGPMFPRYVFIQPKDSQPLNTVRSTLGVISLVAFGGRPASVPAEVIELIRTSCQDGICDPGDPEFREGDRVHIIGGPYEGMHAVFSQETSQKERVIILLEIMASVARVKIDRRFLVSDTNLM
ncbi:MAG: transcriptional activator RfaH [Verrucomicrobiota bacterium]